MCDVSSSPLAFGGTDADTTFYCAAVSLGGSELHLGGSSTSTELTSIATEAPIMVMYDMTASIFTL